MAEEMNWSVAQHATGGPSGSSATSRGLHELMLSAPQEGYQSTSQAILDEAEQIQGPPEMSLVQKQQNGSGSREDRLQQLRQWEQSIRSALSANNDYQAAALGLWRDIDSASARLQDLEVGHVMACFPLSRRSVGLVLIILVLFSTANVQKYCR